MVAVAGQAEPEVMETSQTVLAELGLPLSSAARQLPILAAERVADSAAQAQVARAAAETADRATARRKALLARQTPVAVAEDSAATV